MVIYWKWREILDTISTSTGAARPPVLIKGALYGIVVGLYVYKEWGKYSEKDTNNKAFWYQQFYVCQWAMSGFSKKNSCCHDIIRAGLRWLLFSYINLLLTKSRV